MRRWIWLVVILLGMAGCGPVYADPYTARGAADAAIQSTEAARRIQARQFTMEAMVLQDQIRGTEQAYSMQATGTGQALGVC